MTTPAVSKLNTMQQGDQAFPWVARWIDNLVLAANTAKTYSLTTLRSNAGLPAGQPLFLIFAADGSFWTDYNGTAAIPSGDVTDGSGSEFGPNQRYFDKSVTSISLISAAGCNLSIQVFAPG